MDYLISFVKKAKCVTIKLSNKKWQQRMKIMVKQILIWVPKYINKGAFASFIKINFNTVSVCHHLRKMLVTSILYLKISD